jgi:1-phosphofructokinase family hexose kinase
MLLIITPNPSLDRTMVVPNLQPGHIFRTEQVLVAAGGKGLNVARAAHKLEQPMLVCAPLGGITGQYVARLADEEGFASRWSWHNGGETRTCVLVVDPLAGNDTALNEHGPSLRPHEWQDFVAVVLAEAPKATMATISGSLPPGVPPDAMADLVRALTAAGCRVIVDTSGKPLVAAMDSRPYGVKVNSAELSAAVGMPVTDAAQAAAALAALRAHSITLAIVSMGAQGALAASDAGTCWARPPILNVVNSIGCGDSLMAGLVTGLLRGYALDEALRLGVACGGSDALTIGSGLVIPSEVWRLYAETTVQWM